jgi:hypothetical protein
MSRREKLDLIFGGGETVAAGSTKHLLDDLRHHDFQQALVQIVQQLQQIAAPH